MLLKINNYNKKDSIYYDYFYSVYRSSLYCESFYKLHWFLLKHYKRRIIIFGKRYKKKANKCAKNRYKYIIKIKKLFRRKNRGLKVKGYFFKKKTIIDYKRFKKKNKKKKIKKEKLNFKQKIFRYQKFF